MHLNFWSVFPINRLDNFTAEFVVHIVSVAARFTFENNWLGTNKGQMSLLLLIISAWILVGVN